MFSDPKVLIFVEVFLILLFSSACIEDDRLNIKAFLFSFVFLNIEFIVISVFIQSLLIEIK